MPPSSTPPFARAASSLLAALPLLLLTACPAHTVAYPLGTSLRTTGARGVVRLSSGVDRALCGAVVEEMVAEVAKHDLRKGGAESDIFDTAGMAICLGVVGSYTMEERPGSAGGGGAGGARWGMRRKTAAEKAAHEEGSVVGPNDVEGMLVLKDACFAFCESLQMEVSEAIYKHVGSKGAAEIAEGFCAEATADRKKKKKKKKGKKEGEKKVAADDEAFDPARFDEFMGRMGGAERNEMFDMIRSDRDTPEISLSNVDQIYIQDAVRGLACKICGVAVARAVDAAEALPGAKRGNEDAVIAAVEGVFMGPRLEEQMAGGGDGGGGGEFDYKPGNPPLWVLEYAVHYSATTGQWVLEQTGEHAYDSYSDTVKRNVIMAKSLRRAYESTDMDLSEVLILRHKKKKAWDPALSQEFCSVVCE
eukprot:Rhum_TRINITY_DN4932_c0_g1::Rhum_TRINITY_DN4932_c0_g1_i1::g.16149::m.16149